MTSSTKVAAWAAGLSAGMHAAGIRHVVYVPDNPLSQVLASLRDDYPDIRTTLTTREEEGFGIAAGLYLGGQRPAILLQSSGLGNSLNAITSLVIPYQIPMFIGISMRGDVGEWNAAQVPMGRAMTGILDALGLSYQVCEEAERVAADVRLVATTAFSTRLPGVCLLSRRLTAPTATPR